MACKLLRKCRKEEAPTGVIEIVVQCTKGVVFSWAPYLLNQFLVDCRDAQDNGTKIPLLLVANFDSIGGLEGAQVFIFSRQEGKMLCNTL
jgi:hypothetical protein